MSSLTEDDGVEPERRSCILKLLAACELEVGQNSTIILDSCSERFAEKSFLANLLVTPSKGAF